MSKVLHKKSILKKTFEVGGSTLVSRILGIIREIFMVKYLGVGAISDAFLTAYKIPNSFRKIFAEGALSAAFVPTLVRSVRSKDKKQTHGLMSLGFLVFEGMVLVLCAIIMWYAPAIISVFAPGFSAEQVARAVPLLRILMPFIFFLSSSALLAGALQSVNHFFVPAFSPVLLNIVFITGLLVCLFFSLPVEYLCFFILFGGFLQFLLHLFTYFRLNFSFGSITFKAWEEFLVLLFKFVCCALSMSVMEVSLVIDTAFASYLKDGSISLLYYANRFMGIPLGVFAVAFATILLPQFSHIGIYAPKRFNFYLLETAKLITWAMLPVALVMAFFSTDIFYTIFLGKKFTLPQVMQAGTILSAFLVGLLFFSMNKILLNLYYSLHSMLIPTAISIFVAIINVGLNFWLMRLFDATGLALATSISGLLQTIFFFLFLYLRFGFKFYIFRYIGFLLCYLGQLTLILVGAYGVYRFISYGITGLPISFADFLLRGIGLWLWVAPLCFLIFILCYSTRKLFKIKLYFID